MKKRVFTLIAVLILVGALVPAVVFAAETGTVTCTVSAVLVSVSVAPGTVGYGTVNLGTVKNTAQFGSFNPNGSSTPQTQNITNTGSGTQNYNIKSSNAIGVSQNWTLGAAAGDHTYTHAALPLTDSAYTGGAIGTFSITMTTADSYVSLESSVAKDAVKYLELEIGMPTATTDLGTHTITVTIQAEQGS